MSPSPLSPTGVRFVPSRLRPGVAFAAAGLIAAVASAGSRVSPRTPAGPSRLADGGFDVHALRDDDPAPAGALRIGLEPAPFVMERLRAGEGRIPPDPSAPPGRPSAVGDRLVVALDDGMDLPVDRSYEARLDVSGGPAGPTDAIAVRFPARALAKAPPFRVSSVLLGLDDLHGATTWPAIELWLEDSLAPLRPRSGPSSAATSFDAVGAGLSPAPPGSPRPTNFLRLAVPIALDVPDEWLADGSFDDDFFRPDGPLDDGFSDWLECQDGMCAPPPGAPLLRLVGGAVVRNTTGFASLGVKFPAAAVADVRPSQDIDLRVGVTIRDGDAGFGRAGLALRALAADAFYRVEYVKTPPSVEVAAVTPLGVFVLGSFPAGPSTGSRRLEVIVTGGAPAVDLAVTLDSVPLGTVADTTYRFVGGLVGLSASDPASSGEEWDDMVVERRPDVFVVVGYPPGEDVGLPMDVSLDSLRSDAILVSSDGSSFSPRPLGFGCAQPGNPFVQLEVEDSVAGDRLFQQEAHVVEVAVTCATCPPAVQDCRDSRSLIEASLPSLLAGQAIDVSVGWWNEHLADDSLIFRATAYTGPCDAPDVNVASASVIVGPDAGQLVGPVELRRSTVLGFVPADPGEYCIVVEELHDSNGDCCPDGAETSPLGGCGGACLPVPAGDSNPSTAFAFRDITVGPACTPRGADVLRDGPDDFDGDTVPDEVNLDGASLRVTRGAGDIVILAWDVVDVLVFPARYNVLLMEGARLPDGDCFRVVGPVFDQPSGTTSRSYDLPVGPGRPVWLAVYETDGCMGDASVSDSSADDVALRCP